MGQHISPSRLLALLCGGLVPVGLAAPAAAADPPGNNSTVKVDGATTDPTAVTVPGGSGTVMPAASAEGRLPTTGTNAGPIAFAGATPAAIGAGAVLLALRTAGS
jgi:hypothetical protein